VNDHGPGWLASGDRRAERAGGELRGHPIAQRVADDPVGEHVLDRAAVELIVVDRRAGTLAVPALLHGRGPQPLLTAQPPHPPLADAVTGLLELIGEEPIAERRVLRVQINERVGEVRVRVVAVRARPLLLLVERLGREPEHPAVSAAMRSCPEAVM